MRDNMNESTAETAPDAGVGNFDTKALQDAMSLLRALPRPLKGEIWLNAFIPIHDAKGQPLILRRDIKSPQHETVTGADVLFMMHPATVELIVERSEPGTWPFGGLSGIPVFDQTAVANHFTKKEKGASDENRNLR